MTEPIIYVDQSEVRIGKLSELRGGIRELAVLVEERQPQLAAYRAHLSADGTRMTVIHVHPDADSLDDYTRVAGLAFARFEDLLTLRRIDVYGSPNADAVERLRDKARRLGDGTAVVQVHGFEAGFARDGSHGRSAVAPYSEIRRQAQHRRRVAPIQNGPGLLDERRADPRCDSVADRPWTVTLGGIGSCSV